MAVVTARRALAEAGQPAVQHAANLGEASDKTSYGAGVKWFVGTAAIAIIVLGAWLFQSIIHDGDYSKSTTSPTPVAGLTIFATFFVVAAAIERLLEPISGLMPSSTDTNAVAKAAVASAGTTAATATSTAAAKVALNAAALAVAKANTNTYVKSISLWGIATIIAMLASAGMKLYFLHAVGIASGPRWTEILATGLIVGSGTKPLHDLVTYIQAASAAKAS